MYACFLSGINHPVPVLDLGKCGLRVLSSLMFLTDRSIREAHSHF